MLTLMVRVSLPAQVAVPVGAGSYASFPPAAEGPNVAGMLTTTIYTTDTNRAIPSNDWWTDLLISRYAGTMWAYPLAVSANAQGVNVYYPTTFNAGGTAMDATSPLQVGGEVLPSSAPTDVLLADFESANYPAGWTTTGTAFGSGPAGGTLPGQSAVSGYLGSRLVNSFFSGDGTTGSLTSAEFVVSQDFLHFLIGGGNHPGVAEVHLLVSNVVVRTATGANSEALKWTNWDVSALRGQTAQLRLIDLATGGWGHLCADQFVLSADATNIASKFDTAFAPADARAQEWSDWLVQFRMAQGTNRFMDVTTGHGLPFVWFECNSVKPRVKSSVAARYFNAAGTFTNFPVTTDNLGIEYDGRLYGIYAPDGTSFALSGDTLSAMFSGGGSYLVVGALKTTNDLATFRNYAFAIPRDTRMDWSFDPERSRVRTTWSVTAQALKGANTNVLQGWIPHHYRTTTNDLVFTGHEYLTPRGKLKLASGNRWTIDFPFGGILPTLPAPHALGVTNDFDAERMKLYVQNYSTRTGYGGDTYWGGKDLAQLGIYLNFARELGLTNEFTKLKQSLRMALTDWFTYTPGETEHYFARYPNWRALVGFNESYYSYQFTDHHFHYGYFTHATALLGMHDPQFLADYGPMATQVAKEYANWERSDTNYPFLRTFDLWNGHSYAGGMSSPGGNNQESSSEAMQSWGGLFLLGSVLGETNMAAAGAMGYAMEAPAIEEYWNNYHGWRNGLAAGNFNTNYANTNTITGILFDSGQAYATYFSGDPGWIYGIQWLPLSPMMNHLARDPVFAEYQFTNMMARRAAFIAPAANTFSQMGTGLGQVVLGYAQLFDPAYVAAQMDALWAANDPVAMDNDTPGITYYWTHANRDLGRVAWDFTTSLPTSQCYFNPASGQRSFVIYNPAAQHRLANVYSNGIFAGQALAPPRTIIRATHLLQPGVSFAALGSAPANGETNVSRTLTQIAVGFSTNVNSASLGGASLSGPGVTGITYASGHGTPLIVFNLTGAVQTGAVYQVTIPATVAASPSGATLGSNYVFSFGIETPAVADATPLVAHYRLDETSGTVAADSSSNHLDGVYTNSPGLGQPGAAAGSGHSVDFNGSTHIVHLGTPALLNRLVNDFTIAAWIRPDATGGNRIIFGCNWQGQNGWSLRLSGGTLALERLGPTQLYNSGVAIPVGSWTHLAASYGADNRVTFFTNGVAVASIAGTASATAGTRPWFIGGNGSGENVDGRIDDVQVYRRALTASEVAFLFANPSQILVTAPTQPTLSIQLDAPSLLLTWPGEALGFRAATATSLAPSVTWTPLSDVPVLSNGWWQLSVTSATNSSRFYRLQSP